MTEILSPFMSLPNDSVETRLSTVGRVMDHLEVSMNDTDYELERRLITVIYSFLK